MPACWKKTNSSSLGTSTPKWSCVQCAAVRSVRQPISVPVHQGDAESGSVPRSTAAAAGNADVNTPLTIFPPPVLRTDFPRSGSVGRCRSIAAIAASSSPLRRSSSFRFAMCSDSSRLAIVSAAAATGASRSSESARVWTRIGSILLVSSG
jgi:hypothetical protein